MDGVEDDVLHVREASASKDQGVVVRHSDTPRIRSFVVGVGLVEDLWLEWVGYRVFGGRGGCDGWLQLGSVIRKWD